MSAKDALSILPRSRDAVAAFVAKEAVSTVPRSRLAVSALVADTAVKLDVAVAEVLATAE